MRIFQFILLIVLGGCQPRPLELTLTDFDSMIRDDEFRTPIVTVLTIPF